jgi:restriction endonuclease S subunit
MFDARTNFGAARCHKSAEQHRIVAKVDALMALCDRLEANLTATAGTRRRLLAKET